MTNAGIEYAAELVAFAEGLATRDEQALTTARDRLADAGGPALLVETAAVAANFQRMVRIADSTGIPIDGYSEVIGSDVREELNLSRFGSAQNSPPISWWRRLLIPLLRPVIRRKMRQHGVSQLPQSEVS